MIFEMLAVALGLGVGMSLGALGGGGSTLAVPILVFVAGMTAQDATTASLLVVGIAAAIGVAGHYRDGNVRLGAGFAFGLAGIVGARLGTLLNRAVSEAFLLLAFSGLIVLVAVRMYRSSAPPPSDAPSGSRDRPLATDGRSGAVATAAPPQAPATRLRAGLSATSVVKLAGAATAVGLMTGLFGVGGGFAVVPALTLLLGFETKEAIGTSLVVIAVNATVALGMRWSELDFDWQVALPFLATVTIGVLIGTRVARHVDSAHLTRGFALMLGAVAIYTAGSTLLL